MRLQHFALMLVCLSGTILVDAAEPPVIVYATPDAAAADPDFALQGEYLGKELGVQVVAQGTGTFLTVVYRGGLPGAGWNGTERQETDEDSASIQDLIKTLALKKVQRTSPTLAAKAPPGSIILFDGQADTVPRHWQSGAKIDQGLLQQGCTTLDKYQDFSLHIEFRLPYMPAARGQARGNSGLYLQSRYEVQMLDSFGWEPADGWCGGLFTIRAPDVNMSLPPLSWQTFDIDFTAARWSPEGTKIANARATVLHNGVLIQQDVELPHATRSAPQETESPEAGSIYLQDHGNPVRYRNIWLVPRNAEQEAKRPMVPAFERFYASTGADVATGGRFLLGELNCVACHQAEASLASHMMSRPAPILDDLGKRIHPEYVVKYLADPHGMKPGTLMPDLLRSHSAAERQAVALALTNFLVSTGTVPQVSTDLSAVQRGQKLFREIGCLACHAAPDDIKTASKTAIPLGDLPQKYSVPTLATFLQDPHQTRPSGRMPMLVQKPQEAIDLASYLIGNIEVKPLHPNLHFSTYYGNWTHVPKFEELQPVKRGQAAGFDLALAGRAGEFGMRFEGFLKIERDGDYQFHLGSDDGSLLYIDGQKVADSDGIHPHTVRSGKARLAKGMHGLRVDYHQGGGEATLTLEYEGPGVPRQDINRALSLTEKGPAPQPAGEIAGFQFDPALAEKGRVLFSSIGCANCHQTKSHGEFVKSTIAAPALKSLKAGQGCLAETSIPEPATQPNTNAAASPVPQFDLNSNQRVALTAALATAIPQGTRSPTELVSQTMTAFNCYSCHARGGIGGPTRERNPLFLSTIPEMGDEGRVPPPLDGVGDKLNPQWLQHVLGEGAKDRPYMLTRMPKFGLPQRNELANAIIAIDRREGTPAAKISEAEHRVKAVGRQLVGEKALGCIKCHTFGPHKASGIQAINLQSMAQRVREDWFLRYMINPIAYRPGTRMPTGFPEGKATIRDVYDGNTEQQLAAIWTFLKDGTKAGLPDGLLGHSIELIPADKPIIYRNFIDGLTPRGIAVGYPELGHLAWDANQMALTLIWHGRFIDAGKHWEGRGNGFQGPLGDHVMKLEETAPVASLESPKAPWPTQPPREQGYRFRGYEIDPEGRPHFRYATPTFAVRDFPKPVSHGKEAAFERTLTITASDASQPLYFRAATGKIEAQADGWYVVDGNIRIRLPGAKPMLRESAGRQELLLPLSLVDGKAEVVQEIQW